MTLEIVLIVVAVVSWSGAVVFLWVVMLWHLVRKMKADIHNHRRMEDRLQKWRKERNKNDQSNINRTKGEDSSG